MPIYEYKCDSCHYRFEKKQGFHDKPETVCPKCRGKAHRVIHPAPVIFKGSGFYVTDSRKSVKEPTEAEKKPPKEEKAK
jgi:putative FmdB family regulatory protein